MRAVGDRSDGHRLRALIVLLWRGTVQSLIVRVSAW